MDNLKKSLINEKINEDVEFARAIVACEDAETMKKVFADYGFDVSVEEIEEAFEEGMRVVAAYQDGELDETQLDEVAGGGVLRGTLRLIASSAACFGYGAFCGVCPAASAGIPYVGGALTAWTTAGFLKK